MSKEVKLDLSRIVFIGRTFEEYMSMFNLTQTELKGRSILIAPLEHVRSRPMRIN